MRFTLAALRHIQDLAKDRLKALEDDLNTKLGASEEDWADIERVHEGNVAIMNGILSETERQITEVEAGSNFIVRGRSVDGTCYWDGTGWDQDDKFALRMPYAEAQRVVNARIVMNRANEPDAMVGRLTIVEVQS